MLSVHGRALELLHSFIHPGAKLLVLSDATNTPARIAELLCQRGYEDSQVTVLEHMGGKNEQILTASATEWSVMQSADLNTVAIHCLPNTTITALPRIPGLPDSAYRHDGQLTKREVRAATLARLAPVNGQLLWDVGAGAASIAIEWLRAAPRSQAIAVEQNTDRIAMAGHNAQALGTPQLQLIQGRAPEALGALPNPDAVFIGGGLTTTGLMDTCWSRLKRGGRLVANTVTVAGEAMLFEWQARIGGELSRLAISRAQPLGRHLGWRALMPVTQLSTVKTH